MRLDDYGFIVMEQTDHPGNIGDSAAETGRYLTLALSAGQKIIADLRPFVTDIGILRHPTSPWREDDTSSDQVAPLLAAASLIQPEVADKIIAHLTKNRTGNGNLITPGLWAQRRRAMKKSFLWLTDFIFVGQSLLFKLPFRWNDEKKGFENTEDSSSDYLNFINALAFARAQGTETFACRLALKLATKERAMERVEHYYRPEPNSQWVIELNQKFLGV